MKPSSSPPSRPAPGALSPSWEEDLRRGQAACGERGSVEDELAAVRLLRHAAAPPALDDETAGRVFEAVLAEVRPRRVRWRLPVWIGGLAGATAALALFVVLRPEGGSSPADATAARAPSPAVPAPAEPDAAGTAAVLEAQFAQLAPVERARLARRVTAARRGLLRAWVGDLRDESRGRVP